MAKDAFNFPLTQVFGPTDEPLDSPYTIGGKTYDHFNKGLDYGADAGSIIKTPVAGKVIEKGNDPTSPWGYYVKIQDSHGFVHQFSHMATPAVVSERSVRKEEVIGAVGSTGNSTGPHLSYDVQSVNGGQYIDPQTISWISLPKVVHSNASNLKLAAQAGFATKLDVPPEWRPAIGSGDTSTTPTTPTTSTEPPNFDGSFVGERREPFSWDGFKWVHIPTQYPPAGPRPETSSEAAKNTAEANKAQADADLSAALLRGDITPLPGTTAGQPGEYFITGTGAKFDTRSAGEFKPIDGMPGHFVNLKTGNVIDREGNQIARDTLDNTKAEFALKFPEEVRQFDAKLAEDIRAHDLTAGVANRTASLEEDKFRAEILRNPADYLARAFFQRGGTSPFPQVTQKDLLNLIGKQGTSSGSPTGSPVGTPSAPKQLGPQVNRNGVPYEGGTLNGQPVQIGQPASTLENLASGKFVPGAGGASYGVGPGVGGALNPDIALAEQLVAAGKLVKVGTLNGSTQYVTPNQKAAGMANQVALGGQGLPVTPPVPGPAGVPPVTGANASGYQPVFSSNESGVAPTGGGPVIPTPPASAFGPPKTIPTLGPVAGTGAWMGAQPGFNPYAVSQGNYGALPPDWQANIPGAKDGGTFPAGTKVITGEAGPELVRSLGPIEVIPLKDKESREVALGAPKAAGGGLFGNEGRSFSDEVIVGDGRDSTPAIQPIGSPQPVSGPTPGEWDPAAASRQFQPPAVGSVLGGQMPRQLGFQFALPTPQMLNSLTPDERLAMNTSLAAQYNTTNSDVDYETQRRFGALGPDNMAQRVW